MLNILKFKKLLSKDSSQMSCVIRDCLTNAQEE